MVVEDEIEVVGYAVASVNAKQFYSRMKTDFIPSMQTKYPFPENSFNLSSVQQVSLLHSLVCINAISFANVLGLVAGKSWMVSLL